jgi:hypothetical protein
VNYKINLGCGDRHADGWVNVDHAGMPHRQDVSVDLTGELPWEPGSIGAVYAGHALEHLTQPHAQDLLARLLPLMVPGGQIMVVGPDLDLAVKMADPVGRIGPDHMLDDLRFGADRWPGDQHLWLCTGPLVMSMLAVAGWGRVTDVKIAGVGQRWPVADRGPQWQCAIRAERTAT